MLELESGRSSTAGLLAGRMRPIAGIVVAALLLLLLLLARGAIFVFLTECARYSFKVMCTCRVHIAEHERIQWR